MSNLEVHVLFRYGKKTGRIDTTMTGIGTALMKMWALENTTKTKGCMIFNRETGQLVFATYGTSSGFPKVKKEKECASFTCDILGISLEDLQAITDDRFDK